MGECGAWGNTNVWGTKKNDETYEPIVTLVEIMDEELAHKMDDDEKHAEEEAIRRAQAEENRVAGVLSEGFDDDMALAQALQREFDREYELSSSQFEAGKTVTIHPDRYCPKAAQESTTEEELTDDEREAEVELEYTRARVNEDIPAGMVASKHDAMVAARRNVDKVMNGIGVSSLATGDMIDEKVNNKVFHKLRVFAKKEQKRGFKLKDKEEISTMQISIDMKSRLVLFKWINEGFFDKIEEVIATGKESAVVHAILGDQRPAHFAIKVYKTTLAEFKNRSEYVKDDFRFKNPRHVLKIWAQKEFMNLNRIFNHNVPCPRPIKVKRNVLLMDLIGMEGFPAPRLKDVEWIAFTPDELKAVFSQVEQILIRLYKECSLVHGDLSEFNMLLSEGIVHVIDVSQAMDLSHPRVLYYLLRDIQNCLAFFHSIETPDLPPAVDLFNLVTDLDMKPDDDLQVQVEKFEAENRSQKVREGKNHPADFELRLYDSERREVPRDESPARHYN